MADSRKFINRDISWLSFNYRVMLEAADITLPLYERLKFLAIYSSNLDEFFRVRVGAIRRLQEVPAEKEKAQALLNAIQDIVGRQQQEFGEIFRNGIMPELEKHQIYLLRDQEYNDVQKKFIADFFYDEVLHQLQPILLVKNKVVPFLQNGAIYLVVCLFSAKRKKSTDKKRAVKYAVVKIPSDVLPRFIELPRENDRHTVIFLDDVIRYNLDQVFRGYEIGPSFSFKLSRDADLYLEEEGGDLLEKIKKSLKRRKTGDPARFLYDEAMPPGVLDFLRTSFELKKNEMVPGGRYHNFHDFFRFPNPLSPRLENIPAQPLRIAALDEYPTMFEAMKKQDWLLHFPYQTYDYFIKLLNEAAFDPKVFEIKATQYRVAPDSAIVNALIAAARNGKQVTVFVEVKARFDEESNLRFAQQMEAAGVKIIYSMPGLKVHGKACLVSRKSGNRRGIRQYAYLSTGNFNEKTARIYSDLGYLTSRPEYTDELTAFFELLENPEKKVRFKKLLVARYNMVKQFSRLIEREISHVKTGKKGYILVKLNNLEDETMIRMLYKASEEGVKIDLIVRGICCLLPGKPYSKNITVRRIVDKYLEHARVFVFGNNNKPEVYLSSADWMTRNLYRRIELGFLVPDPLLSREIREVLDFQLRDNVKARLLDQHLQHHPVKNNEGPVRAQDLTYEYLREKYEATSVSDLS